MSAYYCCSHVISCFALTIRDFVVMTQEWLVGILAPTGRAILLPATDTRVGLYGGWVCS